MTTQTTKPTTPDLSRHSRRDFFRAASLLMTGVATFSLTPNFAWAQNDPLLDTLTAAARALFPHDRLPEKFYRASAQGLLDKAAQDGALMRLLRDGAARLDAVYSRPFPRLGDDQKTLALRRADPKFFESMRGHAVVGLYNIPEVWAYFGYQGPSFPQGGYLERGFDDIFWLRDA